MGSKKISGVKYRQQQKRMLSKNYFVPGTTNWTKVTKHQTKAYKRKEYNDSLCYSDEEC